MALSLRPVAMVAMVEVWAVDMQILPKKSIDIAQCWWITKGYGGSAGSGGYGYGSGAANPSYSGGAAYGALLSFVRLQCFTLISLHFQPTCKQNVHNVPKWFKTEISSLWAIFSYSCWTLSAAGATGAAPHGLAGPNTTSHAVPGIYWWK